MWPGPTAKVASAQWWRACSARRGIGPDDSRRRTCTRYAERCLIDGNPLADDEIAKRLTDLSTAEMPRLTFFEISALLALEAFRDHHCDVVVLEVGLGGRLDATNVIDKPLASVVTRIALDHCRILGDRLDLIAQEKAGIFRPGSPAIVATRQRVPQRALVDAAAAVGTSEIAVLGRDFDARWVEPGRTSEAPTIELQFGHESVRSSLGLAGRHQVDNAAAAVAAVRYASGIEVSCPMSGVVWRTQPGLAGLKRSARVPKF